jgi:outer membrane protein OmpA-like peptidoglycan-associated protein
MWEVGIGGGAMFISGDLTPNLGFGGGLHIRKATDYVFSLRGDFLFGTMEGEKEVRDAMGDPYLRTAEVDWMSGTVFGVFSLNSLRWDKPVRKTNFYAMVGGGANFFETTYMLEEPIAQSRTPRVLERELAPHAAVGVGLSLRLTKRLNIGLETQAMAVFGNRADLIDGINIESDRSNRSLFRDIVSYSALNINFNIGNQSTLSEPLYWVNPLDVVLKDINDLKQRPTVSLDDTDGDGVLDALDQEQNTPPNAIVDTRGRTLDSDRDGVPDHLDKEPFYTPRDGELVDEEGVVINPQARPGMTGGVTEERVKELINEALEQRGVNDSRTTATEWFLPMVHFSIDSYTIKYSDYGNLASIARMMKSNPNIRLVVQGFTDATGGEAYNNQLSYLRAKSVIDHLVDTHGIGRGRLVLQWKGSDASLVPETSSLMNRRVEFRTAGAGDFEMDPPASDGDGY